MSIWRRRKREQSPELDYLLSPDDVWVQVFRRRGRSLSECGWVRVTPGMNSLEATEREVGYQVMRAWDRGSA